MLIYWIEYFQSNEKCDPTSKTHSARNMGPEELLYIPTPKELLNKRNSTASTDLESSQSSSSSECSSGSWCSCSSTSSESDDDGGKPEIKRRKTNSEEK